ncbi:MAG TPA: PUA domain-containing protein [Nitrososphaera sp.]|nr:PUA domain-containing protein [Nitrososphaera sp.]
MKAQWPAGTVPKIKTFKVYEIEEGRHLLVSDEITCVKIKMGDDDVHIIPFLGSKPETLAQFPSVKVDMGAIKFVCNGAKVLRPGIVEHGAFKKGDIVTVQDQTHGKILAVGIALEDSEAAKAMQKGYVVNNMHYISDKIWETYKEI